MAERPPMRLSGPVLDTDDPLGLARFYEKLLGWEIVKMEGPRPGYPETDGWAMLRPPDGKVKIEIQWEEHYQPPTWPTEPGKPGMMIHLDILTPDLDAGVEWAIEAGARVADQQPQKPGWHVIMLDPSGHPFCMCRGEA